MPGEHVESSLAHVVGDDARERSKAGYTETIDFIMSNSDCVLCTYGSVSAGREKWPFNVLFFFKVEPPGDQT